MRYSPTSESLKDNKDFLNVYRSGKSAANRALVLYVFPRAEKMRALPPEKRMPYSWKMAGEDENRVGISVSKKVGNSVVRHHLCRLIRESYRINEDKFDRGLDLVVIARPGARELSFSDIERALLNLSRRMGIIRG